MTIGVWRKLCDLVNQMILCAVSGYVGTSCVVDGEGTGSVSTKERELDEFITAVLELEVMLLF